MNWILVGSGSYKGQKNFFSFFLKNRKYKKNSVTANFSSKQKQKRLNKKAQKRMKAINQLTNKAPRLKNKASRKINEIIKIRIEGAENRDIERILPKIIRDTIENIYQMPLDSLVNLEPKKAYSRIP